MRGTAAPVPEPALERPLGAKLEMTHRCNLRCSFCYTDSPRATMDPAAADISDATWLGLADELIALGVLEAVITGGEPLLRRELALELADRLCAARVSVMFNTNGWHVDAEVADRLAAHAGIRVHVSIDGPTPEVHDASRGIPGSWRRAMAAIDLLLARGVPVTVVHVVVPGGERRAGELLDLLWTLGLQSVRVAGITDVGAAVGGNWRLDEAALRAAVDGADRPGMAVQLVPPGTDPDVDANRRRLEQLLIRPNGDVVIDSMRPIAFGNAVEDGVAACWKRIAASSDADRTRPAGHVGYRDPDVRRDGRTPPSPRALEVAERARKARAKAPAPAPDGGDLPAAEATVAALALARPYALADVRTTAASPSEHYVHVPGRQRFHRLSPQAALVMDACSDGAPGDAVEALLAHHPQAERGQVVRDVLGAVRELSERSILVPAGRP